MSFQQQYSRYVQIFEEYSKGYFNLQKAEHQKQHASQVHQISQVLGISADISQIHIHKKTSLQLWESMEYSFFGGGKRFRPVLSLALTEALGANLNRILPFALAIEMIHTYSLIHDDLPCMDDDNVRRGRPTSHKVYGEAGALLAGDALLTESFRVLSQRNIEPEVSRQLIDLLATSSGTYGMISGQLTDLAITKTEANLEDLILTHKNKTSALIEAAVVGPGFFVNQNVNLQIFGLLVGLSFQIADDLLDYEAKKEKNNFVHILGLNEAQKLLDVLTQKSVEFIKNHINQSEFLVELVHFNKSRKL